MLLPYPFLLNGGLVIQKSVFLCSTIQTVRVAKAKVVFVHVNKCSINLYL